MSGLFSDDELRRLKELWPSRDESEDDVVYFTPEPEILPGGVKGGESRKYQSLYAGHEEAQKLIGKPLKSQTPAVNPPPSGIAFTRLLDDVIPGEDRAAQVRRWNEVSGESWTAEEAEAHRFHDQTFARMARMRWEDGLRSIESAKQHRETMREIEERNRELDELAKKRLELELRRLDAALQKKGAVALSAVSLRVLLPTLFSGDRQWTKWLRSYNKKMGTSHASVDVMVLAAEADKARQVIPAMKRQAKETGRVAGGRAGLKKPAAKAQRRPGKKI